MAAIVVLCAAGPAAAYRFKGRQWPSHTITYFNGATANAKALSNAVYAWNRSGAAIRFVATTRAGGRDHREHVEGGARRR